MRLPKVRFVSAIFDEANFVVKRACRSHASPMSQDLKPALAARIRAARLRRRMTQEDLAAQIERTPESISNIERGLQLPSIETMLEICRILGISIADMFEGIGHASRKSRKRFQLEAQLQQVGQQLSDRDLRIAVDQANVLLSTK